MQHSITKCPLDLLNQQLDTPRVSFVKKNPILCSYSVQMSHVSSSNLEITRVKKNVRNL